MRVILLSLLMLGTTLQASEPMCGTSVENDQRILAARERSRGRAAVRSLATTPAPIAREGAFYVQNDDLITTGYRPFDLQGQSLEFISRGSGKYEYHRRALQYVEPAGAPLRDFQGASGAGWHFVAVELSRPYTIFGREVTRIYVSAFNGIHLDPPVEQGGMQFDALEAAVHRGALLSPLMITTRKPRQLEYPRVYVDQTSELVRVTWRSTGNAPFGYDIQAGLKPDGSVTYSYRDVTAMRWGTPIVSRGFNPEAALRRNLASLADGADSVTSQVPAALRQMLNIRRADVDRVEDSDLFVIRIQLMEAIDRTRLAEGQVLGYAATIGTERAAVEIDRNDTRVVSFTSVRTDVDGASARVVGDVIEIYGIQREPDRSSSRSLNLSTFFRPLNRTADTLSVGVTFPIAPWRQASTNFSHLSFAADVVLPMAEPFTLGVFDPFEVWSRLQTTHALSDYDYDGVAMYQSFYTDMIFYAGAYSTGGNPQVDGIAPYSPYFTSTASREPSLLHMNQLTYNYSAAEQTASKVMLHELGHRWLYFFRIRENGQDSNILNPSSAHPAAYVHTPSAFPVYGPDESSAMGGAYFTQQGDGTWKAHAANMGFSWTDLYLMGLAAPEEVAPWFYLANTTLPKEYWPAEGEVVSGERRDVEIRQVTDVHGPRKPSSAIAQRKFRVLFVLVTEEGAEPTAAEVAKMNEWRALLERNFATATGGRATLSTTFVRPAKKRAVR